MKKILLLITALFLLISAEGQILRYSNYVEPTPPPDFTDEYDTVYAAFATKPHIDTADIFNDFVYSLDSAGFWDRAHYLNVYCGASTSADALINWINPGTNNATAVNSPTFTRYRGFDFNGSSQYLNTNFNPYGIVAQDDATGIVYIREDNAEAGPAYSAYDGSGNYFYLNPRNASNQVSYRTNQTADEASTLAAWIGCWIATRRGANDIEVYRNGSSQDTGTDASVAVPNINIYIARHASNYGTRETSLFMVIDGVSDTEAAALNTIIERLHDRLGIGVQ